MSAEYICRGALTRCNAGTSQATFIPKDRGIDLGNGLVATSTDTDPDKNFPGNFGRCRLAPGGDGECKKDFLDSWFVIQDDNLEYYYYTKYIKDLYALFNNAMNRAYLLIDQVTRFFVKKYERMLQLGQEEQVIAELLGNLTIEEYNQQIEQIEEGLANAISTLDDPYAIPRILENAQEIVNEFFDRYDKSRGFDVYPEVAPLQLGMLFQGFCLIFFKFFFIFFRFFEISLVWI